ncbi:MAG: hypothetical protein JWN68_1390 [Nocardioides sp.]|jgi:ribosomal protein S18 acetylase RimI-like enzyme|uniref:GNAT family N-acetyltransferase n=1 Tax=Nocardioides sp. TaxID=35761 RepID=UPI002633D574|nr:GNAT family N-acetyltransferase [Nocardioides sp.]MCW2833437.1 hypothetical protein [Nocardioides sp.]
MWWQVRALLEDRPGTLAALAESCGQQEVNILALEMHPCPDDLVVDELVLRTQESWTVADVERLVRRAGAMEVVVAPCTPRVLQDQPMRYMRAAGRVMQSPHTLEQELRSLLDAATGSHTLVLGDDDGQHVVLERSIPFTNTEVARARELRRLAGSGNLPYTAGEVPVADDPVAIRPGTAADGPALIAMHARCSAETLYRRYHAPMPQLRVPAARALLEPVNGFSMVLTAGTAVIGYGTVANATDPFEIGLLVEDRWQGQSHGTRLLAALAESARERGAETLTCHVQPGNQAVLATIQRAGLRAHASHADGLNTYRIVVPRSIRADTPRRRPKPRPSLANVTKPLVSLLHQRPELREVCPAADLIDQGVRGGA